MPTPCGKFMPHLPSTRYDARLGFEAFTIIPNNSHYEADRTSCTVSDFIRTMQDILAREPSNTASFYVAADSAKTLKLVHDSRMGSHVTSLAPQLISQVGPVPSRYTRTRSCTQSYTHYFTNTCAHLFKFTRTFHPNTRPQPHTY